MHSHAAQSTMFVVTLSADAYEECLATLQRTGRSIESAIDIFNRWKTNVFDKVPYGCDAQWFYEHGFC